MNKISAEERLEEQHEVFVLDTKKSGKRKVFRKESFTKQGFVKWLKGRDEILWSISDPKKTKEDFRTDIMVLRFDKLEFENRISSLLTLLDLVPNIVYHPRLDNQKGEVIAVYFLDIFITDYKVINYLIKGISEVLQYDIKGGTPNKTYSRTNKLILNTETSSKIQIWHALANIGHISKQTGRFRLVDDEISRRGAYWNGFEFKVGSSISEFEILNSRKPLELIEVPYEENEVIEKLPLYKTIIDGNRLTFYNLLALGTSLLRLEEGKFIFKKVLNKLSTGNNWPGIILKYIAFEVEKSCHPCLPMIDSKDNKKFYLIDILQKINSDKTFISTGGYPMKMELAEKKFLNFMETFRDLDAKKEIVDHKIHILKAAPGLGKSELILGFENCVIAAPTHALKDELASRAKEKYPNKKIYITPDLPKFSAKVQEIINLILKSGKKGALKNFLNDLVSDQPTVIFPSSEDKQKAKRYLEELEEISNTTEGLIFTTHQRSILTPFKRDLVIYDEDPLNFLTQKGDLELEELNSLARKFNDQPSVKTGILNLLERLDSISSGVAYYTSEVHPDAIDDSEIMKKIRPGDNLQDFFSFLESYCFVKKNSTIHYMMKRDLPEYSSLLILSASASFNLYDALYPSRKGSRLSLINVEQKGKIEQIANQSFSKSSYEKWRKFVERRLDGRPVITYKKDSIKLPNKDERVYFFNCSGYNHLKGQKIAVVGTPKYPEIRYKLIAKAIDIDLESSNSTYHRILWNGQRRSFHCLSDERMRNIQLELIEGELIQAIGRARTLREEDAHVLVFSDFPLPSYVEPIQEKEF